MFVIYVGSTQSKLKNELDMARKEGELAKSEIQQLRAQVFQLQKQVSDHEICEEEDRKDADSRHREQLKLMQERHEAMICNIHSATNELSLRLSSVMDENSALLERVNAAEKVAETKAKEMTDMESKFDVEVKDLKVNEF